MRQRKKKGGAQPEEFYLFFSDQMLPLELPTDKDIEEFTKPPEQTTTQQDDMAPKGKLAGGKKWRKKGGADEDVCPICHEEKKNLVLVKCHPKEEKEKLHEMCVDCFISLHKENAGKKEISCPLCRKLIDYYNIERELNQAVRYSFDKVLKRLNMYTPKDELEHAYINDNNSSYLSVFPLTAYMSQPDGSVEKQIKYHQHEVFYMLDVIMMVAFCMYSNTYKYIKASSDLNEYVTNHMARLLDIAQQDKFKGFVNSYVPISLLSSEDPNDGTIMYISKIKQICQQPQNVSVSQDAFKKYLRFIRDSDDVLIFRTGYLTFDDIKALSESDAKLLKEYNNWYSSHCIATYSSFPTFTRQNLDHNKALVAAMFHLYSFEKPLGPIFWRNNANSPMINKMLLIKFHYDAIHNIYMALHEVRRDPTLGLKSEDTEYTTLQSVYMNDASYYYSLMFNLHVYPACNIGRDDQNRNYYKNSLNAILHRLLSQDAFFLVFKTLLRQKPSFNRLDDKYYEDICNTLQKGLTEFTRITTMPEYAIDFQNNSILKYNLDREIEGFGPAQTLAFGPKRYSEGSGRFTYDSKEKNSIYLYGLPFETPVGITHEDVVNYLTVIDSEYKAKSSAPVPKESSTGSARSSGPMQPSQAPSSSSGPAAQDPFISEHPQSSYIYEVAEEIYNNIAKVNRLRDDLANTINHYITRQTATQTRVDDYSTASAAPSQYRQHIAQQPATQTSPAFNPASTLPSEEQQSALRSQTATPNPARRRRLGQPLLPVSTRDPNVPVETLQPQPQQPLIPNVNAAVAAHQQFVGHLSALSPPQIDPQIDPHIYLVAPIVYNNYTYWLVVYNVYSAGTMDLKYTLQNDRYVALRAAFDAIYYYAYLPVFDKQNRLTTTNSVINSLMNANKGQVIWRNQILDESIVLRIYKPQKQGFIARMFGSSRVQPYTPGPNPQSTTQYVFTLNDMQWNITQLMLLIDGVNVFFKVIRNTSEISMQSVDIRTRVDQYYGEVRHYYNNWVQPQRGGRGEFVVYNGRRYKVRREGRKKYIICKGVVVPIRDVRSTQKKGKPTGKAKRNTGSTR